MTQNGRTILGWFSLLRRRRLAIGTICLIVLLAYLVFTSDFYLTRVADPTVVIQQPELARCCQPDGRDLCGRPNCLRQCPTGADDLLRLKDHPRAFFLETAGSTSLDFRQSCAVESLARMNPNLTVYLLMTGDVDLKAPTMITLLAGYENLRVRRIHLGDYIAKTPLAHWYFCTTWNYGPWAVSHLSDGLRFLTLYKFGGYYFDLDVVQMRPITSLTNFVVAEDGKKAGSSALHFDHDHALIRLAVEEFYFNYRRSSWAHNGPDLLTRLLKSWCHVDRVTKMTLEACKGFSVLPPYSYYPVWYMQWKDFFYERSAGETPEWFEWDSAIVYGAHVWNSNSFGWPIKKNSNQFYVQMARKSCPLTLSIAPDEF